MSIIPGKLDLSAANGSKINFYGFADYVMDLGFSSHVSHRFAICNVSVPILGADCLAAHSVIIDMKSKKLFQESDFCGLDVQRGESIAINLDNHCIGPTVTPVSPESIVEEFPSLAKVSLQSHPTHEVEHFIETSGPPVFSKPRRVTPEKLDIIKTYISECLAQGILRPSSSPWASPLHLVPKKTGGWRVCGDYRRLNASTLPDRYPLRVIGDLLDMTSGMSCFTGLDFTKAYYQVPVANPDIQKTAVTTPVGLFEYTRMPFGLRNAGCTFQRLLDRLFGHLDGVLIYLDDVLIVSKSWDEHWQLVRQVLKICVTNNLVLNISKCQFGVNEITFLGHRVSVSGVVPMLKRFENLEISSIPELRKSLQRLLGILNFYHRFVPDFSNIASPLFDLLKKNVRFNWTEEHASVLAALKDGIDTIMPLRYPPSGSVLALTTDASGTGCGAVLEYF